MSPAGCRCCPRRCSSCGGRATGACCSFAQLRAPAAACAGQSRGWPRTPIRSSTRRSSGSRAASCCGSPHGEDGALVRRRLAAAELERIDGAPPVLAALTDARLLTVSDGEVEVSHEALLREWPRYRGWLEEDRVGRRLHAHLTAEPREWDARGRDAGDLYRGARLAAALDWSAQHRDELNPARARSSSTPAGPRPTGGPAAAFAEPPAARTVLARGRAAAVHRPDRWGARAGEATEPPTTHRRPPRRGRRSDANSGPRRSANRRLDLAMLLAREAVNLDRCRRPRGRCCPRCSAARR